MIWISLIVLLLVAFLVILSVQRLGNSGPKPSNHCEIPWIHPSLFKALPHETLPFRKRQLGPDGRPQAILDPQLFEVSPWDWERIPGIIPLENYRELSPQNLAKLEKELLRTPGSFIFRSPSWPVCCSQLGVLLHSQGKGIPLDKLESEYGPLDQAFLENELKTWGGPQAKIEDYFVQGWADILSEIRAGTHSGQGINFFRCETCKRIYIGSCSP